MKININKLSSKAVDILGDAAVTIENNDLKTARELMYIAHLSRPNGPFTVGTHPDLATLIRTQKLMNSELK
jgi:hypothetical protein